MNFGKNLSNSTRLTIFARSTTNRKLFMSRRQIVICAILFLSTTASEEEACNEEWAPAHGEIDSDDRVEIFSCPHDGAITEIDYSYASHEEGKRLHSISFVCSSSDGLTRIGPFGKPTTSITTMPCKQGEHISYIRGRAGKFVNDIQIKCVKSGQPVAKITQIVRSEHIIEKGEQDNHKRNIFGLSYDVHDFDDSCYSKNGRRPVAIRVYIGNYVSSIRIQYVQMAVAFNCIPTQIELTDKLDNLERFTDYHVLGSTVGSTCNSLVQQLCLSVVRSDSESSVNIRTSTNNPTSLSATNYIKAIAGAFTPILAVGGQLELSLMSNRESDVLYPSMRSKMTGSETELSQKTTINYQGPGAAVVVGYRSRYVIDSQFASVRYNYTCEVGSTPPTTGKIPITGDGFGNVYFQDYQFPFNNTECTTEVRLCISRIKLDGSVINPKLFGLKLRTEVTKCLNVNGVKPPKYKSV